MFCKMWPALMFSLLLSSLLWVESGANVQEAVVEQWEYQTSSDLKPWSSEFVKIGGRLVGRCKRKNDTMFGCLAASTFRAIDRLAAIDVIHLPFDTKLVKDTFNNDSQHLEEISARKLGSASWHELGKQFLARVSNLIRSHSLHIPLPRDLDIDGLLEGRRRHRRPHHRGGDMMGLMLFGSMAMAVIAIPLGFQFLAVLGGKALMLAKLALILTSIQGLKKIATSNMSYGNFDRRWPDPNGGLYDGFETAPEARVPHLDAFRSRFIMPRIAIAGNENIGAMQHHHEE